ncbi:MAG: hypothetical protein RR224_01075 [Clostridia bacterium]
MQEDNKITVKFELTNEFGSHYIQESHFEVFHSLGDTELDCIGEQFNVFLKQIGYVRKNDYMLMEDLTEEEVEALADYLDEIRAEQS